MKMHTKIQPTDFAVHLHVANFDHFIRRSIERFFKALCEKHFPHKVKVQIRTGEMLSNTEPPLTQITILFHLRKGYKLHVRKIVHTLGGSWSYQEGEEVTLPRDIKTPLPLHAPKLHHMSSKNLIDKEPVHLRHVRRKQEAGEAVNHVLPCRVWKGYEEGQRILHPHVQWAAALLPKEKKKLA